MCKNDNQREPKGGGSDYGLRISCFLLLVSVLSFSSPSMSASEPPDLDKLAFPVEVSEIAAVYPFTLEQGYRYDWRQEQPIVQSGNLVVLKVDPALVYPRNAAEPVLYAGMQTAQRLNHGHESGYVIAIVPGDVDLTNEPLWFGRPNLPERINAEAIRSERASADRAGIESFGAARIHSVRQKDLHAANLADLLREHAADLVLTYSPGEEALAATWRLPVAKR